MRQVTFEALITKSINRAKLILFRPFSLKKWMCLLLIAYLAGAISGGGNFRGGGRDSEKEAEAAEQEYLFDAYDEQVEQEGAEEEVLDGWTRRPKGALSNSFAFLKSGIGLGIIAAIGFFVLIFLIFFIWLSSRFKFIWFTSIVANDASIKEPFNRYKKEGDSLFRFLLVLTLVGICCFGLLAFWVYSNAVTAGVFEEGADIAFMQLFNIFALPALVLIVVTAFLAVLAVCIDHFAVTIMAVDHCSLGVAWRKTIDILGHNKKDFFLYLLVLLGLGIATSILEVLIAFVCIIALLIVAGLLLGLPYLLIVGIFKAQILFVIFAIIVALPLLVVAVLLFMSIGLPFAVFFKSFSLYFVSSLDCGYNPLLLDDIG